MQRLWLTPVQLADLGRLATNAAPEEICGMLVGTGERVEGLVPVPNIAPDPTHYYHFDERTFLAAWKNAQAAGQSVIGFYHSHPKGEPIPSASDIALAQYPEMAYLIVGLKDDIASFAAWRLANGVADALGLHVGTEAPVILNGTTLRSSQKLAIIIGALLALGALLVIAWSLLPPAPEIPALR